MTAQFGREWRDYKGPIVNDPYRVTATDGLGNTFETGETVGVPKRSKYAAQPTTVDNIRFASKKEAKRYGELKALEAAGEIKELTLQPVYELLVSPRASSGVFDRVCVGKYIADFRYRQGPQGILVIEDVKSGPTKTPIYRLKKKMVEAIYDVTITEV
jgi:hypothetical protein